MSYSSNGRVYQFIDSMIEIGSAEIAAEFPAMEGAVSEELMRRIAHAVCVRYARTELYIPAALDVIVRSPRNQQIYDAYAQDGVGKTGARRYSASRVVELAKEHSLTTRQVQKIIADLRSREAASRQRQLPGFEPQT